jgi:hypothetical protein
VRLIGTDANRDGIGTALWLEMPGKRGPLREVQAGSGYWSQNSAVQILQSPTVPSRLLVRWPDGEVAALPIAPGTREVSVRENP